ncbi:hypothetical protein [Haladaptatus sp. DFWS20]|uniref:hypothetical protein n=1 Tax=Haladaptatus sp. DFWS20 TaxID=3403467 RepID=UPI003EB7EE77
MQRRQFLQNSVLLGIAVSAAGCANSTTNSSSATQNGDEGDSSYQYDDSDSESYDTGDSDTVPEAPPRESEVFETIELDSERRSLVVTFESSPVVEAYLDDGETTTGSSGDETENGTNQPEGEVNGTESGASSNETGSLTPPTFRSLLSFPSASHRHEAEVAVAEEAVGVAEAGRVAAGAGRKAEAVAEAADDRNPGIAGAGKVRSAVEMVGSSGTAATTRCGTTDTGTKWKSTTQS